MSARVQQPAAAPHAQLDQSTLQLIVNDAVGPDPVCIRDLAERTFGAERVRVFERRRFRHDPELEEFVSALHTLVDHSWRDKGVTLEVGPYLSA